MSGVSHEEDVAQKLEFLKATLLHEVDSIFGIFRLVLREGMAMKEKKQNYKELAARLNSSFLSSRVQFLFQGIKIRFASFETMDEQVTRKVLAAEKQGESIWKEIGEVKLNWRAKISTLDGRKLACKGIEAILGTLQPFKSRVERLKTEWDSMKGEMDDIITCCTNRVQVWLGDGK